MERLPAEPLEVLIIGAGFSGLCVAALIKHMGVESFLILEKGREVGGTWRDNDYPGCACDIPSHLYSLSFEPNAAWSQMFAPQGEILAYLKRLASARGLLPQIRFGCAVEAATWDEAAALWRITTARGGKLSARVLVSAIGALHHPVIPAIPGLEQFRGERFHSATWNHDYELAGKRVAVVGTGASAIQFVPRIVDRVARLHVFQRTPPWIVPKANRPFDHVEHWRFRNLPLYRRWFRSRLFWIHEQRLRGFTGGAARMQATERLAREQLERQVRDPVLRAKLTPDYAIGCKRLLISSEWYPALQRANAEVVTEPVREVRASSIVSADGVERAVDALIFGTGFDTQNNLRRLAVRGRHGRTLAQAWGDTMQGYLGTLVAGFPNLFVMLGPNSGLTHNSQIFMIEAQARFIRSSLKLLRRRNAHALDVRANVQAGFNRDLHTRLTQTVWQAGGCRSWYQDAAGHNTTNWPGSTLEYWWLTRRARAADLEFINAGAGATSPAVPTAEENAA